MPPNPSTEACTKHGRALRQKQRRSDTVTDKATEGFACFVQELVPRKVHSEAKSKVILNATEPAEAYAGA